MPNDSSLLLLNAPVVESLLAPDAVLQAVREAFVLHCRHHGRCFPVVREALPGGGVFGIKSGDVPVQGLLGFKAAGFWPANRQLGSEPHQATILLFAPATGRPLCVIDGNAITTARTGAAGALGLQMLARPESTHLTVFGTGVQAAAQLDWALRVLPVLTHVSYVSHDRLPRPSFEAQFGGRYQMHCAQDADAAVVHSDVVITATPARGPLFDAAALRAGTHLNCVGADTSGKRELPEGVLARAHLFVDDREQASRLGELQWSPQTPCTELGEVVIDPASFQRNPDDITVFDMTGLALQDLTLAREVYQSAVQQGLGCAQPWPW